MRPEGKFLINMKAPNGDIYPSEGVFKELIESEKLVFTLPSHEDKNGNSQVEMLNTVTFTEKQGKTEMTLQILEVRTIPGVQPLKGLDYAWGQSFDKLEEALET